MRYFAVFALLSFTVAWAGFGTALLALNAGVARPILLSAAALVLTELALLVLTLWAIVGIGAWDYWRESR